jgi:riboflavin-specific deaminase-like protein
VRQPRITISYAQSLDGRIATSSGQSRWISGPDTLQLAQELRRDNDAILVGIGTVERDDPLLTCRLPGCPSPVRVVLDTGLRLGETSRIAATADRYATVVCAVDPDPQKAERLTRRGVRVEPVPPAPAGGVALPAVLDRLAAWGIETLYVEGGSSVITAFLKAGLVDRLIVVTAPMMIGQGIPSVGDLGVDALDSALRFRTVRLDRKGDDVVWELEPASHG